MGTLEVYIKTDCAYNNTMNTLNTYSKPFALPVGYDNFGAIRERGYYYVDKSLLVRDILDDSSQAILITRPRRFGKSLNLSMLQYYFASVVYGRETKKLFDGLKILQAGEEYTRHQGKYPVIFLTFKDLGDHTFENAYAAFAHLMSNAYGQFDYLLDNPKLKDYQKETFNAILNETASEEKLKTALRDLMGYLFLHHNEQVWLLIDEYDTPIQSAYIHNYYEPMVSFMRHVLGSALKTNPYLNRAVLTGILRVSQESLFSDLNNVEVYSLLKSRYAEYFGFTEPEVIDVFTRAGLPLVIESVKSWYNGYQIGQTILYNPWSIVHCVKNQGELDVYWVNTSSNQLVRDLFVASGESFRKDLQRLLSGQSIQVPVNERIVFVDLKSKPENVWSLLLMAGYLKIVSREIGHIRGVNELTIPNQEILMLYQDIIESWLDTNIVRHDVLLNDLLSGHLDIFEKQLARLIQQLASFHDMAHHPEAFYQGFLLGLTASISPRHYLVKSNHESGDGRYDILMLPYDKQKMAILLELKSVDSADENKLLKTAHDAIQQIRDKHYADECIQAGCQNIVLVGLAFHGKKMKMAHQNA